VSEEQRKEEANSQKQKSERMGLEVPNGVQVGSPKKTKCKGEAHTARDFNQEERMRPADDFISLLPPRAGIVDPCYCTFSVMVNC
jgi:hypothetical protein